MKKMILGVVALVAVGCGGDDTTACTFSQNGMLQSCVEYSGITNGQGQKDALDLSCKMSTQMGLVTAVVGSCPSGKVGGCKQQQQSVVALTWYYPPKLAADIMSGCKAPNTYVTP